MNAPADSAVAQYFNAIRSALGGLEIFLGDRNSPLYRHGVIGEAIVPYLSRLKASFACWENRIGFVDQFRISRAESGFPVYQNVLELENDRKGAEKRLSEIPGADHTSGWNVATDTYRDALGDFLTRSVGAKP